MIGKALWQNLKTLVDYDKNVIGINEEILANQKSIDAAHKQIEQLKKLLDDNNLKLTKSQKNIDFYELQAETLEASDTQKRKQLDNIKNPKEYRALEKEIAAISSQCKELEDLLLNSYHQLDLDKTKTTKDQELNAQKIEQLALDIEAKKTHTTELEQNLAQSQQKRAELAKQIPAEWMTRYENMRHRVTDPIVPVLNGCCSVCFYSILHQDMSKLKKADILACRSCYRFLYYDEEEQKDVKIASY